MSIVGVMEEEASQTSLSQLAWVGFVNSVLFGFVDLKSVGEDV